MKPRAHPAYLTKATQIAPVTENASLALARGLNVLRLIADSAEPLNAADLTRQTGIPLASVNRITSTFVSLGLLQPSADSGRFALTAAVLALSSGFLRNFDLCSHIKTKFEALADKTGGTVQLGVRDRLELTLVQSVRPHHGVVMARAGVGTRLQIGACTIGRAFIGGLGAPARQKLLVELQAASANAWPYLEQRAALALAELDRLGFTVGGGDWNPLVGAVATPLLGPAGEHYAVSCVGPLKTFSRDRITDEYGPLLLECVREIAAEIGGRAHL